MQKFPSKVDQWSEVFLWLLISAPVWVFIANSYLKGSFGYLQWILLPTSLFLVWIRFRTVYIIDGQQLIYQSGPIRGSRNIMDIHKIHRTTNDPFNSGNLSSDKISIRAKRHGSLNISPENKNEFIEALLAINPNIEVVD
ncbi:MAG: PH domain-containing protein [Saprospiraceae bacterium]